LKNVAYIIDDVNRVA